jgi:hypothetical protein
MNLLFTNLYTVTVICIQPTLCSCLVWFSIFLFNMTILCDQIAIVIDHLSTQILQYQSIHLFCYLSSIWLFQFWDTVLLICRSVINKVKWFNLQLYLWRIDWFDSIFSKIKNQTQLYFIWHQCLDWKEYVDWYFQLDSVTSLAIIRVTLDPRAC